MGSAYGEGQPNGGYFTAAGDVGESFDVAMGIDMLRLIMTPIQDGNRRNEIEISQSMI